MVVAKNSNPQISQRRRPRAADGLGLGAADADVATPLRELFVIRFTKGLPHFIHVDRKTFFDGSRVEASRRSVKHFLKKRTWDLRPRHRNDALLRREPRCSAVGSQARPLLGGSPSAAAPCHHSPPQRRC